MNYSKSINCISYLSISNLTLWVNWSQCHYLHFLITVTHCACRRFRIIFLLLLLNDLIWWGHWCHCHRWSHGIILIFGWLWHVLVPLLSTRELIILVIIGFGIVVLTILILAGGNGGVLWIGKLLVRHGNVLYVLILVT